MMLFGTIDTTAPLMVRMDGDEQPTPVEMSLVQPSTLSNGNRVALELRRSDNGSDQLVLMSRVWSA